MEQITIISHRKTVHLPLSKILYLESILRKVNIYTIDETFEVYDKMEHFDAILCSQGFLRCHQSYIISIEHISSYDADMVHIGKTSIPVSKKYRKTLKQFLSEKKNYGRLYCVKGENPGAEVAFRPGITITIGRNEACSDFVIDDTVISRRHAELIYHDDENRYELMDLSTNGTFIDDMRMVKNQPYILTPGTKISFSGKNAEYMVL